MLGVGLCPGHETGWATWIRFAVFPAVGPLVYVGCGRRNSTPVVAGNDTVTPDATDAAPQEA